MSSQPPAWGNSSQPAPGVPPQGTPAPAAKKVDGDDLHTFLYIPVVIAVVLVGVGLGIALFLWISNHSSVRRIPVWLLALPGILLFVVGQKLDNVLARNFPNLVPASKRPQPVAQAGPYGATGTYDAAAPYGAAGPYGAQGTPPQAGYGQQTVYGAQGTTATGYSQGQAAYGQTPQTGTTGYGQQPPYGQAG